MDSLIQLHPSLRNMVAAPGTFAQHFPETTDADLTAVLLDGLAEAHLDALLLDVDATDDGSLTAPITRGQGALISLLAGIRLVRAHLFNTVSHRRYEAGGAVFEEDLPVALLRDLLKDLTAHRAQVTNAARNAGASTAFAMADQYAARLWGHGDGLTAIGAPASARGWW